MLNILLLNKILQSGNCLTLTLTTLILTTLTITLTHLDT